MIAITTSSSISVNARRGRAIDHLMTWKNADRKESQNAYVGTSH